MPVPHLLDFLEEKKMINFATTTDILKTFLVLIIECVFLWLSTFRMKENQRYSEKCDNSRQLILRLVVTYTMKLGSLIIIWGVLAGTIDVFIAFYGLLPLVISLNLIFFNTEYMRGTMMIIKGVYYIGLASISMIQFAFDMENIGESAIGFTMALAIFESISAIDDGIKKMLMKNKL